MSRRNEDQFFIFLNHIFSNRWIKSYILAISDVSAHRHPHLMLSHLNSNNERYKVFSKVQWSHQIDDEKVYMTSQTSVVLSFFINVLQALFTTLNFKQSFRRPSVRPLMSILVMALSILVFLVNEEAEGRKKT